MSSHPILLLAACLLLSCSCDRTAASLSRKGAMPERPMIMDGLSFVAPPSPIESDAMEDVLASGANWIAVIPLGFTRLPEPKVYFDMERQWWGERTEGTIATIKMAQNQGIRVMLKPQVYVPRAWTGAIDFDTEEDWQSWEKSYRTYILSMAHVADSLNADLFCIGTEFKASTARRHEYWQELIREIRSIYRGPLTYAANWDEYPQVTFWNNLDYIGIDAYFPLTHSHTPSVEELKKAWEEPRRAMNDFAREVGKPYLFTEYGYMSVDSCASPTWELEARRRQLAPNEEGQANALQALFEVFWEEPAWSGGFLWKWYPHQSRRSDFRRRDYTPQGKVAAKTLKDWYSKVPE